MCGIFGQISKSLVNKGNLLLLAKHSKQRGKDSSGLIHLKGKQYHINRASNDIEKLFEETNPFESNIVLGHSRLITNGLNDNQPVISENVCVIHNGIIVNEKEIWKNIEIKKKLNIDSEAIVAIVNDNLKKNNKDLLGISNQILKLCKGIVSCALLVPEIGKIILFSNNGSLYKGEINEDIYFASEKFSLDKLKCQNIIQIIHKPYLIEVPVSNLGFNIKDISTRKENLIPEFSYNKHEERLLEFKEIQGLKRCTKCILPQTMPFIEYDEKGICNFCNNYKVRNKPKPKEELFKLVEVYRRSGKKSDCIIPFSGGRDSCYSLHLIVNDLGMKPITYTYDWGMVTDLGRRNISRMCGEMGIENIIVAADISLKRKNIKMNLQTWLKSPHLGMMAILTAGDKHFFKYVEDIKNQVGINLNLWGVNPLETTHFKTGFLGIKPNFYERRVYMNGMLNQFGYHFKRFGVMLKNPGYFNSSLWDTLSGEYYRSFLKKKDYYHVFDYYRWDEDQIINTLIKKYNWETASDTEATWRIGDGTAGFYNYVYYTVAGFTEHDTFRSNQIREGQLSRDAALKLIRIENKPRYQNIKWYIDTLALDFEEVIRVVNSIPKLY